MILEQKRLNSGLQKLLDKAPAMDYLDYQDNAMRTKNSNLDSKSQLNIAALGLAGESGEVADMIKKWLGQGHSLNVQDLIKELGDILWYVALACDALDTDMQTVAILNIDKLKKRYPEGFDSSISINRYQEAA